MPANSTNLESVKGQDGALSQDPAARELERLSIDTIRVLAMDSVQKANAGHPGTAMALAPVAYLIYTELLRHNPADPAWPDRDRFVLSAGHACILQYAALHLTGYDLSLDDLKQFRQWGSRTPGHPEHFLTPGVRKFSGWPGVREPHCRNCFRSSSDRS